MFSFQRFCYTETENITTKFFFCVLLTDDVPVVQFMYLIFTRKPGESNPLVFLRSCSCVFQVRVNVRCLLIFRLSSDFCYVSEQRSCRVSFQTDK